MTWSFVVAVSLLAACDGGQDTPVDASTIDARQHPIVGRWTRRSVNIPPGAGVEVELDAGGRYHEGGNPVGTWRLDGDDITITRPYYMKAPLFITDDRTRMFTDASFPITPTQGLIGTWSSVIETTLDEPYTSTMEFREGGKVLWTETGSGRNRSDLGDYTVDGDHITIDILLGGSTPARVGLFVIPDVAIGSFYHDRVD